MLTHLLIPSGHVVPAPWTHDLRHNALNLLSWKQQWFNPQWESNFCIISVTYF